MSKKGTVYLVHLDRPFWHAKHYMGFTERDDVETRLEEHRNNRGSKLLRAVNDAGIPWRLSRTWEGMTRSEERRLKRQKMAPRLCPVCVAKAKRMSRPVCRKLAA